MVLLITDRLNLERNFRREGISNGVYAPLRGYVFGRTGNYVKGK